MLGGRAWLIDIVPVACLGGRVRPLLKCSRAHEGNYQALYFRAGVLACRHCHELRYSSRLAANSNERLRIRRIKIERGLQGPMALGQCAEAVNTAKRSCGSSRSGNAAYESLYCRISRKKVRNKSRCSGARWTSQVKS